MAVIKGNDFSHDDDDTRQARLALLSENIDTYAGDINVTGVHLTWAQGAFDVFVDYRATAAREDGDIDEATQEYRIKYDAAHKYYVRAKALLNAILGSYQDNDEAAEKYGTMRDTPRNVDALHAKIVQWKDQHDIYVAEGDPRVVADAIVTEMITQAIDFYAGWKFAITQKREAAEAYDRKQAEFLLGSKYLKLIYQMAVMVWGDEDPRLIELGFQTASGIWSEGQPEPVEPGEPGSAVHPDQVENLLVKLNFLDLPEVTFNYSAQPGVTFNIYKADVKIGYTAPKRPAKPWLKGVEGHSVTDSSALNNRDNYYWVVAVLEGVEGEFATPVFVKYKESEEPIVPE